MTKTTCVAVSSPGAGSARPSWGLLLAISAIVVAPAMDSEHARNQRGAAGGSAAASAASKSVREIDALVETVAAKYPVPRSALRPLVRTAYHEGVRLGVDPLLVVAVMGVESGFDARAKSPAGALGPMQVIPRFHTDKFDAANGESVHDPKTNIRVGVKALKEYIARGGDPVAGLQRYNGAAGDPHQRYAKKVLREKRWLKQAIARSAAGQRA